MSGYGDAMNKSEQAKKVRGVAMVREVLAAEHREMQARAYQRLRPCLSGAMRRLRRAYPAFSTVVFCAKKAAFALVFSDATRPHEAPAAFRGLAAACGDLARMSEIEWLTAGDPLWQIVRSTPQPATVIEQYRHIENKDWQFWMRRPLNEARYYMRQDVYSRTIYGSHRPGYGKRIVTERGEVVDEWVEPVEPMILRVLRERGAPVDLDSLCRTMESIAGFAHGAYYYWDVLTACERMRERGMLRRCNPKSSEGDAKFALTTRKAAT